MSFDSQEYDAWQYSDIDASMSSAEELYHNNDFDSEAKGGLFHYLNLSVFDDPCPLPPSVSDLFDNAALWEFLEQTPYDVISKTTAAHPYPGLEANAVLVKKSGFPAANIYLYHSQELEFYVQIGQKNYHCIASATQMSFAKNKGVLKDAPIVALDRKHARFFVLNPTGLYRIKMTENHRVLRLTNTSQAVAAIAQIVAADPRARTQPLFKLTSQVLSQIRQICPPFCRGLDLNPPTYSQKTRHVRLLKAFYPNLPIYASDQFTLVMPYLDQPATLAEIIQEAIRLFLDHGRIVADMALMRHFKKDYHGNVVWTAPDLTFSIRRRVSQGSVSIQKNIVYAQDEVGAPTPYQRFLSAVKERSIEETKLIQMTLAFLYLYETTENGAGIEPEWMTESWLQLVYIFSVNQFPLDLGDLEALHDFGPLLHQICQNIPLHTITGEQIYYRCIAHFIQQADSNSLRRFLQTLSHDTVAAVLTIVNPTPLISAAVVAKNPEITTILLGYDADPALKGNLELLDAIDSALLIGFWDGLGHLLNKLKLHPTPTGHGFILWSNASPGNPIPTKDVVAGMRDLSDATQFQLRLKCMWDLAFLEQSEPYTHLVHSFICLCKVYLEKKEDSLPDRKKTFIRNCRKLLRHPFPALSTTEATQTMQTTIQELENALSLARDPTNRCTIS